MPLLAAPSKRQVARLLFIHIERSPLVRSTTHISAFRTVHTTSLRSSTNKTNTRRYKAESRGLFTSTTDLQHAPRSNMAGDDDYMAFLDKANEDPSAGAAQSSQSQPGKKELKAADHGADIPQPLVAATKDAFYVSDSDEPFVPVSLTWSKGQGLPNEGMWLCFVGVISWTRTDAPCANNFLS